MNTESILKQFDIIEKSVTRAKLPFETDMLHPNVIEVSLWELMKSMKQIENVIREIAPDRFGAKMVEQYHEPNITTDKLHLCPHCGEPECGSDHK